MILKFYAPSQYDDKNEDHVYYEAVSGIRIKYMPNTVISEQIQKVESAYIYSKLDISKRKPEKWKSAEFKTREGKHITVYFQGVGWLLNNQGGTIERI
jgi:hypothetical protein